MSSDTLHQRITEVLIYFGIQEDFQVQSIDLHDNQSYQIFLGHLTTHVSMRYKEARPVDFNCLLTLLCEFTAVLKVKIKIDSDHMTGNVDSDTENEDYLLQLVALFPFTQPSNSSVCKLFDIMRTSARIQQQEQTKIFQLQQQLFSPTQSHGQSKLVTIPSAVTEWTNHNDISFIPVRFHTHILSSLQRCIIQDNPPHIFFPGDKLSSLQTSPIPVHSKKGYMIAVWVKPLVAFPSNEFCLFRGKNPNGTFLEFKCLPQEKEGSYYVAAVSRDDTASDRLTMTSNQWHFLTIRHLTTEERDVVDICVDGELQFSRELLYPKEEEPQGIIWTIGNGFKGQIASFTLYEQPLANSVAKFIYSLGPYVTDIKQGISQAQSSFDSGYVPLGCQYAKGEWSKLCKVPSSLSITPLLASLDSVTSSPPDKIGKVQPDYIHMVPPTLERDSAVIVNLNGKCLTNVSTSWMESILEGGGVNLLLYLLWTYSALKFDEEEIFTGNDKDSTTLKGDDGMLSTIVIARDALIQSLSLLSSVIEKHVEAREQFIQCHGFHIIASCLSSWPSDHIKTIIDNNFIDALMKLVKSFGPDIASLGDGIASALQGLLLDFSIWGSLDLRTLLHYLTKMSSICFECSDGLHKYIGMQKVLDIFRINLNKVLICDVNSNNNSNTIVPYTTKGIEGDEFLTDGQISNACADEIHRLLIILKDSALNEAQKAAAAAAVANAAASTNSNSNGNSKESSNTSGANNSNVAPTNISAEAEMLLLCLEETGNSLIAERVSRVLSNIRMSSPVSLRHALFANRFWDTMIVTLWTKRCLSLEVRQHAFVNLIWLLTIELKPVPVAVMQFRKELVEVYNHLERMKNSGAKLRSTLSMDATKMKQLQSKISDVSKGTMYAWKNVVNLSQVLRSALDDGVWGNIRQSCLAKLVSSATGGNDSINNTSTDVNYDFDNLLIAIMNEAQNDTWLLIPFLPPLVARVSNETMERVLASVNVQVKTEETQSEIISIMDDRTWIDPLVELLLIGIIQQHNRDTSDFKMAVTLTEKTVIEYGTSAELALDTLSSILVHKIRMSIDESAAVWDNLHDAFIRISGLYLSHSPQVKDIFILYSFTRAICLVLQRLVKLSDDCWSISLVKACAPLLKTIHDMNLCGLVSMKTQKDKKIEEESNKTTSNLLIDLLDDGNAQPPQTMTYSPKLALVSHCEGQLFRLVIDLSSIVRNFSSSCPCDHNEWRILKRAYMMLLQNLPNVDETNVELISREIKQHVQQITQLIDDSYDSLGHQVTGANASTKYGKIYCPYNPVEYKKVMADTMFGVLEKIKSLDELVMIPSSSASNHLFVRKQLIATVDLILQYFREQSTKIDLSSYVQDMAFTLGKLCGSNDIELIDKVLRAEWKDSVISFAEDGQNPQTNSSHGPSLLDDFETVDRNVAQPSNYPPTTVDLLDLASISDPSAALDLLDYAIPMVLDFGSPDMLSSNNTAESLPDSSQNGLLVDIPDAKIVTSPPAGSITTEDGQELPASNAPVPTVSTKKMSSEGKFNNWLKVRVGISTERVDTERARMTHSMSLQDLSSDSTRKHWKKLRRKIESESFQQSHRCQWKLGIAHEGPMFGRKRIVLRPRFENLYATLTFENAMKETLAEMEGDVSTEQLERALAKECSGYIKDVTRTDTETGNDLIAESAKREGEIPTASPSGAEAPPGTGWGIVDADGSDEGFGVVGLAKDVTSPVPIPANDETLVLTSSKGGKDNKNSVGGTNKKPVQDLMGELHLLEEKQKHKRAYDTGPCPSGASKCDPGQVKFEARVILVTASGNSWGFLSFNNEELFFRSSFESEDIRKEDSAAVNVSKEHKMRRRRWRLDTISAIYLRRYRLRDSALEVFFRKGKHRNFFVDFGHTREDSKIRTDFAKSLMTVAPNSAFKQYPNMSPFKMVFDHGVQEKWLSGKMSNFDYLMALNTIAGRTYNDLCQYPVMPWVLTDYTSESIDLSDSKVYRDLSKPMGALNEQRLREFLDRFHSFEENTISTGIPAFMYGSHYSTMVGVVLHFLVRLQPFAALHQEMQNGHFDVPDRLFSSIPRSFLHNTTQLSEVKEITPEWYTTPDMFRNVNKFDFGQTQDGEVIDDVELPRWARGSAEEFVRIHREALESDFVSEHLHEWIDLIFGYKQRGPDSVEANNVFYYLTYYGAVDHYMIQDEAIRKATELQIAHFGQTPMQLFKAPHPAKKVRGSQAQLPLTRSLGKSLQSLFPLPSNPSAIVTNKAGVVATANLLGDENDPTLVSTVTSNGGIPVLSDEEQLALDAPVTLVIRKTDRAIVKMVVLVDRIICILDNGVTEVLKYSTSDEAKTALATAQAVRAAAASNQNNSGSAGNARRGSTVSNGESTSSGAIKRGSTVSSSTVLAAEDILFGDYVDTNASSIRTTSTSKRQMSSQLPQRLAVMQPGESMIAVEKEYTHFEVIPKVPLPPRSSKLSTLSTYPSTSTQSSAVINNRCVNNELDFFEKMLKLKPASGSNGNISTYSSFGSSTMTFAELQAKFVVFNRSCKLCFTFGRVDGVVSIRELDQRSGAIKSGGDFSAHHRRVISVASDTTISDYDIVASLDESGQIFVWTILHPKTNDMERSYYTISRRPQKTFRCAPNHPENMQLALSSHLGVVIVVSGGQVYIFSLERNELLRTFKLTYSLHVERPLASSSLFSTEAMEQEQRLHVWNHSHQIRDSTFNGPIEHAFGNKRYFLHNQYSGGGLNSESSTLNFLDESPKVYLTRRFVISDFGYIVLHVESFLYEESILEFEDHLIQQHLLLAYTISGQQVGIIQSLSGITALSCPDHGEIVISGHRDGSVMFYQVQNLAMLYKLDPSSYCVQYNLALPGSKASSSNTTASLKGQKNPVNDYTSNNDSAFQGTKRTGDNSAVIAISLGPNRFAPAVVCISTEAGNVFIKAMPDFIKWEKNRSPSAFAQLASVPLQAVKGTLIQAQNWTAETAGVFAQNAKTFADDAISELKKMKRNSIVKGVASFFGVKTNNEES